MLHREVGVEPEARRLLRQIQRRTVELNLEFEFAHQDIIRLSTIFFWRVKSG